MGRTIAAPQRTVPRHAGTVPSPKQTRAELAMPAEAEVTRVRGCAHPAPEPAPASHSSRVLSQHRSFPRPHSSGVLSQHRSCPRPHSIRFCLHEARRAGHAGPAPRRASFSGTDAPHAGRRALRAEERQNTGIIPRPQAPGMALGKTRCRQSPNVKAGERMRGRLRGVPPFTRRMRLRHACRADGNGLLSCARPRGSARAERRRHFRAVT